RTGRNSSFQDDKSDLQTVSATYDTASFLNILQIVVQRLTSLSAQIVRFCRYLREREFHLGFAEEALALEALACAFPKSPAELRLLLRATLVRNLRQLRAFDEHFDTYWRELKLADDAKIKERSATSSQKTKPCQQPPSIRVLKNWLYGNRPDEEVELAQFSPAAVSGRTELGIFSGEEMTETFQAVRQFARRLAKHPSRRFEPSRRKTNFDLRRTLRQQMRSGGDLTGLFFKQKKKRKTRLVLLCDVSRSMELYSRFLIQVLYGFQNSGQRIETFVFSTSLSRVTPQLLNHTLGQALENLSEGVPHWSGGTRIGLCLQDFLKNHASRFLHRRNIVLILSDGLDTGEMAELSDAMNRIQRRAAKVIWLNPLAGQAGYQPSAAGMQAALPFVDLFAGAHDLESLKSSFREKNLGCFTQRRFPAKDAKERRAQRIDL
ncbi:MAG: VWA domain-containing protein, partial [Bacteroidota bacterium]